MDAPIPDPFLLWSTFLVIAVAVAAYASDRWEIESVSAAILVSLLLLFELRPLFQGAEGAPLLSGGDLLLGFANPALLSILALLIIGRGLNQTGALDGPSRAIMARGLKRPRLLLASLFVFVAAISAVMNNTPVVVMFIPILASLGARIGEPTSRLMIPLSYLSVLGGMTTLIGSSTNLLVAQSAEAKLGLAMGFFDFTLMGLMLAGVGAAYTLGVAPRLLPRRAAPAGDRPVSGKHYLTEIVITPGHPLEGVTSVSGFFPSLKGLTLRAVERQSQVLLPPFEEVSLSPGDRLVVAATRRRLAELMSDPAGLFAPPAPQEPAASEGARRSERVMSEGMVTPGSRLIGRTLEDVASELGLDRAIVGVERRSRMARGSLKALRIEAGDVLLLMAERVALKGLRERRDILMLEWSAVEIPDVERAHVSILIFAATIFAAASGLLPIATAAICGAFAMVATGCLNLRQAARVIDRKLVLLIAAALAMGAALEATGGAALLANGLVSLFAEAGPAVLLSALFLLVAVMTNLLSNNATAVLFAPLAIGIAQELEVSPWPFVHAVIFAANCCFVTPFAYQTNLLVMGPGHYRFTDYVRAGLPLLLLLWLTFSLLAPVYYAL